MKDNSEFSLALDKTSTVRESFGDELKKDPKKTLLYFSKLIELADKAKLSQREACFLIADTMWYPSVDKNPGLEAIVGDAGELELPDEHIDGHRDERWKRLKSWVQQELEELDNQP